MQRYEWGLLLGIPTAWVALFFLYCVRVLRGRRYEAPALVGRSTSLFLPRTLLEFGYWLYEQPVRAMARAGITANMLTYASLLFSGVAAVLIGQGRFGIGGWILLLGFTCDVF